MIRFEIGEPPSVHAWEGEEPTGRAGVDLFDAVLATMEADGFAGLLGTVQEVAALARRLARRDRRALVLRTLTGFTVDGSKVTDTVLDALAEDRERRMEAATVVVRIWQRAGFFAFQRVESPKVAPQT